MNKVTCTSNKVNNLRLLCRRFTWDNDDWPGEATIQALLAWEVTTR